MSIGRGKIREEMASAETGSTSEVVRESVWARASLIVLASVMFLVPLVTGNVSAFGLGRLPVLYDDIALPRMTLAILGVCLAAALGAIGMASRGARLRGGAALLLLAVVAVLAWASTVAGVDPLLSVLGQSERLEGAVAWSFYALAAAVALHLVDSERSLRVLAAAFAASAGLLSIHGLAQFAGADWATYVVNVPGFDPHRAFATLGNPNFLAGVLVLAWPVGVGLAISEDRASLSAAWWGVAALASGALLATFTRGAWAAALIQVAVAAWALRRSHTRFDRRILIAAAAVVAVLLVVGVVSLGGSGETNIIQRLTVSASIGERVQTLITGANAVADRPLLGWGPDAYLAAFRAKRSTAFATQFGAVSTVNNAHSWPLQAAVTLGPLAALLFVAALVAGLRRSARFALAHRRRAPSSLRFWVWLGCLGFVLHMLSSVAVWASTAPFFLLLGAILAPPAEDHSAEDAARRPLSATPRALLVSVAVIMGLSAIVAAVVGVAVLRADNLYLRSRLAARGEAPGDPLEYASAAASLNPTSVKYARGQAGLRANVFYDAVAAQDERAAREAFEAADSAFSALVRSHPGDFAGRAWYSALLGAGARYFDDAELAGRAREQALAAMSLDPLGGQTDGVAQGRFDDASLIAAQSVPPLP